MAYGHIRFMLFKLPSILIEHRTICTYDQMHQITCTLRWLVNLLLIGDNEFASIRFMQAILAAQHAQNIVYELFLHIRRHMIKNNRM